MQVNRTLTTLDLRCDYGDDESATEGRTMKVVGEALKVWCDSSFDWLID